jgi:hypothetical protein
MAWSLDDFRTKPLSLKKQVNVTVTGFGLNNAPWNQQAVVLGDTYDIIDYGKGPEGTAAVASETGHQITVNGARGTGGNAYLLPWAPDTMCVGEVQQAHDLFFTYRLNGCGIIVSGGRSNPTVVHANTKSDAIPVTHDMQAMTAAYRTIYQGMAAHLATLGIVDPPSSRLFVPGDHGYVGLAAVFGARSGGKWTFYATIGGTGAAATVQIWP